MSRKQLYLIDGHALAYRSYFATIRTPMSNSKGQPTGALFAFTNSVLSLLQNYDCTYIAVVFDSPKPTYRHEIYKDYKANREAMADDMRSQMNYIHEVVGHLGIKQLSKEGLEADDVLAWLARKAAADGFEVRLVTKDKDLMQVVGDGISMLSPEVGGKLIPMGPEEVREKMGVEPRKIRDLLALMGDSSDNIPGVPGIGPKTAAKILAKAGDIDTLLSDPSVAGSPKLQKKIEENREAIILSRDLVTIHDDHALGIDVESLKSEGIDKKACVELFTEMEFSSLLRSPLFQADKVRDFETTVVTELAEVEAVAAEIRKTGLVSLDTETTSTVPREARLVGLSLAVSEDRAYYIPVGHAEPEHNVPIDRVLDILREVVESEEVAKIGQNLKYDYQVLRNHGIRLQGISFDTMVAAYLIDPGKRQYGLDGMATEWLGISLTPIEALIGKGKTQKSFARVPVEEAAPYSGEDAVVPLRLKAVLEPILAEKDLTHLFETVEVPLVTVLAEMEWQGITIDTALMRELSEEHTAELATISQDIYAMAGEEFNLNSPKQVSEILFGRLQLPRSKRTKTGLSTNVAALEKLAPTYPIARRILDYREVQKLLSTYIDALPLQVSSTTGRLHSSFNQTIASTGRLSSTNPNLQNIPVRSNSGIRIREAFVAAKGHLLVSADYSQIELRILAHLSGDTLLCQAFHEDADIHTQTASAIYGVFPEMVTPEMRRSAKTINFGLMYGMGAANLSRQLGISFKEAENFIETYFLQFPSIRDFMQRSIQEARERGYSGTLLGRRRYLPEIGSERRQIREAAERTAINTPVQGSAADIIKIAMVNIHREMASAFPHARLLLQVHDELVFETPKDSAEELRDWVVEMMSNAYELSVALKVDAGIGKSWREAH